MENLKSNNINKVVSGAIAVGATLGVFDANAEGTNNATPSPDAKSIKIEETSTLEKEGVYVDNAAEINKISLELAKNEKAIRSLASEIKNKLSDYNNKNLIEAMIFKFQKIEVAEEYFSDIFNPKYANLTTFFNDAYSKKYLDLKNLNILLNSHITILNKLGELNRLADCYAPVVLEHVVRPAEEGERTTVEKVNPSQNSKEFIPNNPGKQAELPIDPKHKSKLGYALENLGDNLKDAGKKVVEVFKDENGCYRCGPPGGQIWR